MKNYSSKQKHCLKFLFLIFLLVSFSLWCYGVFTTTIDIIELNPFSMFLEMPATFWIGFGFLISATIVWYISPKTEWHHLLLVFFWTLFIFIGPELAEVNARGADGIDHLLGVTYIEQTRFSEYFYAPFPGFVFFSHSLSAITGIEHYILPKLVSLSFHLLRVIALGFLGFQLFNEKRVALLFTLIGTAFLWEPQQFDPCPQNLGITFFAFIFGLLFSAENLDSQKRLLLIIFFGSLVLTHVLTTFVALLLIIFFSVMLLTRRQFGYSDIKIFGLPLLFGIMFITWLMKSSDWVFTAAVETFVKFIREPWTGREFLISYSPYREFTIHLTYLFYGFLLLWMFTTVASRKFLTSLSLKRVFSLLCSIPLLGIILAYGEFSLPRLYIFASLFLAWFLTQESWLRKKFFLCFLIILPLFSFAERYSAEYIWNLPAQEYKGAEFLCKKIPLSATVYCWRIAPDPKSMANVLDIFHMYWGYEALLKEKIKPGRDFQFAPKFIRLKNEVLFYRWDEDWELIAKILYKPKSNIIYTNGEYQIYSYPSLLDPP